MFGCEEGARSWAVETGLAPDKGRKASRGEIGTWELSVAGEITEAGCEGNDLYRHLRYSSDCGEGQKTWLLGQRRTLHY